MNQYLFDVASPNAYLAHRLLPAIEQRTGRRFTYVPVLLGGLFKLGGSQSPMMAFANIPSKLAYERLEMTRFIARHGLGKFRMNPHFPVNTLMAMRGAVAAEAEGLLAPYAEAMFVAMWEQGLKLDDPAVLGQAIADAGLPAERLLARAQDQAIKDRLLANTRAAHDAGAFGLPSFLVGDDLFFGKERLAQVEQAMAAG